MIVHADPPPRAAVHRVRPKRVGSAMHKQARVPSCVPVTIVPDTWSFKRERVSAKDTKKSWMLRHVGKLVPFIKPAVPLSTGWVQLTMTEKKFPQT